MSTTGFDWTAAPLGPEVRVIRIHPCGIAALEKPAGVLSHPNSAGDAPRAVLTTGYDDRAQCFTWTDGEGIARRAWLLHRLDSATSGVVLLATREAVAEAVRAAFEKRLVRKRYIAIVFGHPRDRRTEWRDAIEIRHERGTVRASTRGGAPAETTMTCVRAIPGPPALSVLELEPHTGRTHQLRVQCARRHLPILGDQTYGDFRRNREFARRLGTDRLFLHARQVELEFAIDGGVVRFSAESPLPSEFQTFLRK